jgi:hypothetical protein
MVTHAADGHQGRCGEGRLHRGPVLGGVGPTVGKCHDHTARLEESDGLGRPVEAPAPSTILAADVRSGALPS